MAERVPARLTAAQGRRFGLTVGLAFLVLSAIAWWRGHPTTVLVLGSPGTLLVLAGLLIPTQLGPVERAWMKLAHLISRVTTPIVMGIMYFGMLTVVGVIRRALGSDPMRVKEVNHSLWQPRPEGERRTRSLQRQF